MRFFCVRNQNISEVVLTDMVKVILQTPYEARCDNDHNKVFEYFKHDIYLNTLEKTRGIAKLMLSASVLEGMRVDANQVVTQQVRQMQYMVVLQGSLRTHNATIPIQSGLTEKQARKAQTFTTGRKGCFIAYLSKQKYQQFLGYQLEETKGRVEQLKKFMLFNKMAYTHLLFLAESAISLTYRFRQQVYNFAEESEHVYCILNGSFEMTKRLGHAKNKSQTISTTIEAGQTFGEAEVFLRQQRETQVRSLGCDNLILKIPSACLLQVYQQYPDLLQELLSNIEEKRTYNQQRSVEIYETHNNYKSKLKLDTELKQRHIFFPKLQGSSLKPDSKVNRQKPNNDLGFQLMPKDSKLNQQCLRQSQQTSHKYSKKDILCSLGAQYLVPKLRQPRHETGTLENRSSVSVSDLPGKWQYSTIQFPLIEDTNIRHSCAHSKKLKIPRLQAKHQTRSNVPNRHINQQKYSPLDRLFSLDNR